MSSLRVRGKISATVDGAGSTGGIVVVKGVTISAGEIDVSVKNGGSGGIHFGSAAVASGSSVTTNKVVAEVEGKGSVGGIHLAEGATLVVDELCSSTTGGGKGGIFIGKAPAPASN